MTRQEFFTKLVGEARQAGWVIDLSDSGVLRVGSIWFHVCGSGLVNVFLATGNGGSVTIKFEMVQKITIVEKDTLVVEGNFGRFSICIEV